MSLAKTQSAAQRSKAKASEVKELDRISGGTVFDTKLDWFFSGRLQEADGKYQNQQRMLDLLPDAPDGHHWCVKLFVRETKSGRTLGDVVFQIEEDYQKPE